MGAFTRFEGSLRLSDRLSGNPVSAHPGVLLSQTPLSFQNSQAFPKSRLQTIHSTRSFPHNLVSPYSPCFAFQPRMAGHLSGVPERETKRLRGLAAGHSPEGSHWWRFPEGRRPDPKRCTGGEGCMEKRLNEATGQGGGGCGFGQCSGGSRFPDRATPRVCPPAEASPAAGPAKSAVSRHHPPSSPRLLDQVRNAFRVRHFSLRTEQAYLRWIREFILHHQKQHPRELGAPHIQSYLTHWAVERGWPLPRKTRRSTPWFSCIATCCRWSPGDSTGS